MAVSKKTTVNEAAQDETEQAPQTVAPKRRRAPAKRAEKEVATLETAGLKLSVEASEEAVAPKTKPVRRRTRKTAEAAEAAVKRFIEKEDAVFRAFLSGLHDSGSANMEQEMTINNNNT